MERTPNHPTVIDGLRRAGAGGRMIEARKLGLILCGEKLGQVTDCRLSCPAAPTCPTSNAGLSRRADDDLQQQLVPRVARHEAGRQHLDLLRQDVDVWNTWNEARRDRGPGRYSLRHDVDPPQPSLCTADYCGVPIRMAT